MRNNKIVWYFLSLILLALAGYFIFEYQKTIPESKQFPETNFEECKQAGYPIIGKDPEKCQKPDGEIFADDIVGFEKCRDAGHIILESDPAQCEGSDGVIYANKAQSPN